MERRAVYPVDTASFERIIKEGMVYVDKTAYIHRILQEKGQFYFLARPRRFGKSLFLDTLHRFFKGNRELFKGLAIDRLHQEEWESFPVLHFNLTGIAYDNSGALWSILSSSLNRLEKEYEIQAEGETVCERFNNLIINLTDKTGKKVVILIDEYDTPLSSAIDKPELQEIYREQLYGFYSVLKKCDNYIKLCMLTGVTRYGKVSVFSGLNNLKDITFSDAYAGICGITEEELHHYYSEGAGALAKAENISVEDAFSLLKFNYDGYHFSKSLIDVYNPFSINNALQDLEIKDYWCRSGVPTLLSKSLMENDFDLEELIGREVDEAELTNLSFQTLNPVPLFYQTGYLTLKKYDLEYQLYTLGYPNREVEKGILNNILQVYSHETSGTPSQISKIKRSLKNGNPEEFVKLLGSFFSNIPVSLHERVSRYENYYHSIVYCIVQLIGLDVDAEFATSQGYIDILIRTEKYIYLIELKVNGSAEDAIRQIETMGYGRPFEADHRKLFKIGIGFSKKTHTIESCVII